MVLLATSTGLLSSGCPFPGTIPPPATFPQRPVVAPPGAVRVSPLRRAPVVPVKPEAPSSRNPWKPLVAARKWTTIVIHHTATNRGSVESIHAAHLKRKDANGIPWKGIGYHFVIGNGHGMPDGAIETTFRWRKQLQGAHAGDREHNEHGIGIALVGNFEKTRPTPAQLAALKRLVSVLKREYGIPAKNVIGHNDIRATACPGKNLPLAEIRSSSLDRQFARLPASVRRNASTVHQDRHP